MAAAGTQEVKTPTEYTNAEALDEAVLRLYRRMLRLHADAFQSVLKSLPEGARYALLAAEARASMLREADVRSGVPLCTRRYPDPFASDEA